MITEMSLAPQRASSSSSTSANSAAGSSSSYTATGRVTTRSAPPTGGVPPMNYQSAPTGPGKPQTMAIIFVFMWVRWTVPRFRYDQVMKLGWQKLLPLAIGNLLFYAAAIAIIGT